MNNITSIDKNLQIKRSKETIEKKIQSFKNKLCNIKTKHRGTKIQEGTLNLPSDDGLSISTIEKAEVRHMKEIDVEPYLKVYPEAITLMLALATPARRVLAAFLASYTSDKGNFGKLEIYFNYNHAHFDHGYNRPHKEYYQGLKELTEKEFVQRVPDQQHRWELNPTMFFQGNRIEARDA